MYVQYILGAMKYRGEHFCFDFVKVYAYYFDVNDLWFF